MLEKAIDVELPKAVKFMLLETNGSLWFMEKEAMNTKKIQSVATKLEGTFLLLLLHIVAVFERNSLAICQ
jgi:hypothetical protein